MIEIPMSQLGEEELAFLASAEVETYDMDDVLSPEEDSDQSIWSEMAGMYERALELQKAARVDTTTPAIKRNI